MIPSRILSEPAWSPVQGLRRGSQGACLEQRLRRRAAAVNESIDASRWNQSDFGLAQPTRAGAAENAPKSKS
jgi:hypothetical protein